jgi:lipoic acid synthetase
MNDTLPAWIRARKLRLGDLHDIRSVMARGRLHTVCDEARCPNRSECFSRGTATFLIMGDVCTRSCRYCSIAHGRPRPLDPEEPAELARAVVAMGLKHVVVTSVDRDDLPDGGATHFAAVVRALHGLEPRPTVEVLTPDFRGDAAAVEAVVDAGPDVYNHNVETVPRLYRRVRFGASFERSRAVLAVAKRLRPGAVVKSGFMVGLGEAFEEAVALLASLRETGVDFVTIGQYLQPSREHLPVERYWHPEEFDALAREGRALGIAQVASGPLVRSSYHAQATFEAIRRPPAAQIQV